MHFKKRLKQGIIVIIGSLLIISSLRNIFNQWRLIAEAQKRTQKIGENIDNLKQNIDLLEKKIKWATSSAYLEQAARDKLGLGTKDDYWIEIPEENMAEISSEVKEAEKPTVLKQWADWFTR
jgi:cell division protein FtsB